MNIIISNDYDELSLEAANLVAEIVKQNAYPVLGLATGSTPEGMYKILVEMYRNKKIDFRNVVSFNLDEYIGISSGHPQSYYHYMFSRFYSHVNINPDNIHIPNCQGNDCQVICKMYDEAINAAGGIDIQVLGIGSNGHIGFNEPSEKLYVNTHVTDLAEETIKDNSRFFGKMKDVPRQAITMGVGAILKAKKVVLLAYGSNKANAIRTAFNGEITTSVPASFLQLHSDLTLIADRDAVSLLDISG